MKAILKITKRERKDINKGGLVGIGKCCTQSLIKSCRRKGICCNGTLISIHKFKGGEN